jgi:hypothetical protein
MNVLLPATSVIARGKGTTVQSRQNFYQLRSGNWHLAINSISFLQVPAGLNVCVKVVSSLVACNSEVVQLPDSPAETYGHLEPLYTTRLQSGARVGDIQLEFNKWKLYEVNNTPPVATFHLVPLREVTDAEAAILADLNVALYYTLYKLGPNGGAAAGFCR